MKVTAIKTHKITAKDKDLFAILDTYLPKLKEESVVAITSKIISIFEGRIVPIKEVSKVGKVSKVSEGEHGKQKDELIAQEAQYFLPRNQNKWRVSLTIARNNLVATAGIDESNGNGYYILWPKNPQETANAIRLYLKQRFNLNKIGVVITDSKTTPLRWGTTGFSLAHSGFAAIRDYIGKPDVFGRKLVYTKLNVADSLAAMTVLAMGEGKEQTPIAIIENPNNIVFQKRNPSKKELASLRISKDSDLYAPLLKSVKWKKGRA